MEFNIPFQTENVLPKKRAKKERCIEKLAETFINDKSERNFYNLMSRVGWGLQTYIYGIVGDRDATNDVMSRTMEQIYFKCDMFKNEIAKFSTWIYKIAFNNSLKYLNDINIYGSRIDCVDEDISNMFEGNVYDNVDSEGSLEICGYSDDENVDILFNGTEYIVYSKEKLFSDLYDASVDCINYLPDICRIVMTERYIDQKKVNEIAERNHLTNVNVKNLLVKARKLLNIEMQKRYTDLYNIYINLNN